MGKARFGDVAAPAESAAGSLSFDRRRLHPLRAGRSATRSSFPAVAATRWVCAETSPIGHGAPTTGFESQAFLEAGFAERLEFWLVERPYEPETTFDEAVTREVDNGGSFREIAVGSAGEAVLGSEGEVAAGGAVTPRGSGVPVVGAGSDPGREAGVPGSADDEPSPAPTGAWADPPAEGCEPAEPVPSVAGGSAGASDPVEAGAGAGAAPPVPRWARLC